MSTSNPSESGEKIYVTDYLYVRRFRGNWAQIWKTLWYLFRASLLPGRTELGDPPRCLPQPGPEFEGGEAFRRTCREVFDAGESRIAAARSAGGRSLGFIGTAIPLFVALFVFLVDHKENLGSGWVWPVVVVLWGLAFLALVIALLAGLRCLGVASFKGPFLPLVMDDTLVRFRAPDPAMEGREYLDMALYNQVRADELVDFLRASQIFFGLAVAFALTAGLVLVVVQIGGL